jgi:hypothetical protein
MLVSLIPKMGQRASMINELEKLKKSKEVNIPKLYAMHIFINSKLFKLKLPIIHK